MVKKTLTIAGSDSSGGAGIQADIKTFQELGTFGFTAITCIVTMDPRNNWSHSVAPISSLIVAQQMETVLSGGPVDSLKTGMLGDEETIKMIRKMIDKHQLKNVVIDPVMICKGTTDVLQPENVAAMKEFLFPVATVVTPNLFEAMILSGLTKIDTLEEMKEAAIKIRELGPQNVVIKGGKALDSEQAIDLFYDGKEFFVLSSHKIESHHTHGAGCTFSAAMTSSLAKGLSPYDAAVLAKKFVTISIESGLDVNPFVGHIWHGAYRDQKE